MKKYTKQITAMLALVAAGTMTCQNVQAKSEDIPTDGVAADFSKYTTLAGVALDTAKTLPSQTTTTQPWWYGDDGLVGTGAASPTPSVTTTPTEKNTRQPEATIGTVVGTKTTEATEMTPTAGVVVPYEKPVPYSGDLNGDGEVDMTDLTTLSLYLVHDISLESYQMFAADVTASGKVDLADLATLKMMITIN